MLTGLFLFGRYFHHQTQLKAAEVLLRAEKQQKEDNERALREERMPALLPAAEVASASPEAARAPQHLCAGCGARMPGDAKFCDACGRAAASECPKCGASNRDGARFCKKCGALLHEETESKAPAPKPATVPTTRTHNVQQAAAPGAASASSSKGELSWTCRCGTTNAMRRTRCRKCDGWNPH